MADVEFFHSRQRCYRSDILDGQAVSGEEAATDRRCNLRRLRKLSSLVLPGTAQVLRGRTGVGLLLVMAWTASLVAAARRQWK